jgi:hypothetical protein
VTVVEVLAQFHEATVTEHGPTVEIDLDRTIGNAKIRKIEQTVESASDFGEWLVHRRLFVTHWRLKRYNVGQLAEGLSLFREEQ